MMTGMGSTVAVARAEFLYDGDCAFCTACARFIVRWIPTPARVTAWQQADLGRLGLTERQCGESVQWVVIDRSGRRSAASGAAAVAALLHSSTRVWRGLGWVLARRPVLALAGPIYRWVARNRHRFPGGTPTCALPAPSGTGTGRRRPGHGPFAGHAE
jgi:predicted DCC family thiol-disulfide oxidoreductase YuxK